MLEFKLDIDEKSLSFLDPKWVDMAATKALNDAARSARAEASRSIRQKFNISASRVNKEIRNIKFAKRGDLHAIIQASGRPIGLTHFGARWTRNVGKTARTTTSKKSMIAKRRSKQTGVKVKILKGKMTHLSGAFIGRARRGKVDGAGGLHVFERTKRGLINKAVITLPSMMSQENVIKSMIDKANEVFEKRFWYHYNRYLDKASK